MNLFKCGVCGYVHQSGEAPDVCPKCGAPKEKFAVLSEDAAKLIVRSVTTNLYHMEIVDLLTKAEDAAKSGIEDNLDPGCVKTFESIVTEAKILKGKIMAELATHMTKGKWGM